MKERPIIFSKPMVQAILEGRKSQTRRIVKTNASGRAQLAGRNWHLSDPEVIKACPFGAIGNRLWVREAFHVCNGAQRWNDGIYIYRADHGIGISGSYIDTAKWKPSIFMPRLASRITLEITGIRVERLREISEEDAKAEGCEPYRLPCHPDIGPFKAGYSVLWESINGAGSWDRNQYVWVISFRRID